MGRVSEARLAPTGLSDLQPRDDPIRFAVLDERA